MPGSGLDDEYTPSRYAVLEAIAFGPKSCSETSKMTGLSEQEVLEIISFFEAKDLVEKRTKGLIFRKEVYGLTVNGLMKLRDG